MAEPHQRPPGLTHEQAETARRHDYAKVFGGEAGARVLADLAAACHAERLTYVPGDAMESAYREGQRSVYLRIRRLLTPLSGA